MKTTYGIVGNPLAHSLSPLMHNAAFKALDVDATYVLLPLKEYELDVFFKELRDADSPIWGLNITVPYKETVIQYMDSVAPLVEKINAVNTVVINEKRKLVGYNTDAPGFMAHLAELGFNTADKKVAILGAGGSARAILGALCLIPEQPQRITVFNRTPGRVESLLEDLKSRLDVSIVQPAMCIDDLEIEDADLLINTTSVGLHGNDPCLVDENLLQPGQLVYDLIYNPVETPLLTMAKKRGAMVANGLGMLYYQGVLAFQHWAGQELDESIKLIMREALEEGVENL